MRKSLLAIGAILVASTFLYAHKVHRNGQSILHFRVRSTLLPAGENTNVTGHVGISQNRQGRANNQRLNVGVANLEVNALYHVWALMADEPALVYVSPLHTDTNGTAALRLRHLGSGKGHGVTRKNNLPVAIQPVSRVQQIIISDNATQAVLAADATLPDSMQYLVKRPLQNDGLNPGARGSLHLHATTNFTHFRLRVSGLPPSTQYYLALNGMVSQTNTTDTAGHVDIMSWLIVPTEVLDVRSVALWDTSSNSVLSTTLP